MEMVGSVLPPHMNPTYPFLIGLLGGKVIGLPPVLNFGSDELKARVVPDVLEGKKFICLAISEAHAGSDVMGLQTTAVKSEDGKEWIINGKFRYLSH
jgi:alkylation response protein AidB-like acyl-CoA dehydrogenase